MDLLQFLISFFINEYGGDFKPLLETLKNNNFDIKKTVSSIKPETVAPIIKQFMSKSTPKQETYVKLEPIKHIADNNIVTSLNTYFESV